MKGKVFIAAMAFVSFSALADEGSIFLISPVQKARLKATPS